MLSTKRTSIILAVVLCVLIVGAVIVGTVANRPTSSSATKEFVVGVVLPLTGPAATYGNNALRGLQLAQQQTPALQDGRSVRLAVQDSRSDTKQAVGALRQLIATGDVFVVIGDTSSSSVLAMAPVAQAERIVVISPGASNPEISKSGDFIFRTWQSDAVEGSTGGAYARDVLKWKKVASLYINNAYGQGLLQAFNRPFGGNDRSIEPIPFAEGAADLRPQIAQLKSQTFDGVYLIGFPNELVLALRQLREQNVRLPILATQAIDDPAVYTRAAEAADGVMFTTTASPDPDDAVVRHFAETYQAAFHIAPGLCSDAAFDAFNLVVKGLNTGARDAAALRDFLITIHDFHGASGTINFDSNGDVIKPVTVMRITQGHPATVAK